MRLRSSLLVLVPALVSACRHAETPWTEPAAEAPPEEAVGEASELVCQDLLASVDGTTVRWLDGEGGGGAVSFVDEGPEVRTDLRLDASLSHVGVTATRYETGSWAPEGPFEPRIEVAFARTSGEVMTRYQTEGFAGDVFVGHGLLALDRGHSGWYEGPRYDGVILYEDGSTLELPGWRPKGKPVDGRVPVCDLEVGDLCGLYDLELGLVTIELPEDELSVVLTSGALEIWHPATADPIVVPLAEGDHAIADQRAGFVLISTGAEDIWTPTARVDLGTGELQELTLPVGVDPLDYSYCGAPTSVLGPEGEVLVPLLSAGGVQVWRWDGDWSAVGEFAEDGIGLTTVGESVAMLVWDYNMTFCPAPVPGEVVGLESGDLQILRDGQVTVFEGAYDGFWLPGGSAPPVLSSDGSCAVLQSAFYDIEADQVVDLPSEGWFWLPVSPS